MNTAGNGMQDDLFREVTPKKRPNPLPKIIVMLILAGILGFYLFSENEPAKIISMPAGDTPTAVENPTSSIQPTVESVSKPAEKEPSTTAPLTPQTIDPPGSSARALIVKLRAKKGTIDLEQVIKSAEEFTSKAMHTDAYLLYFFAARQGHSQAAQVLAKQHDPAFHSKQTSMLDEPDLVQAYKWYQQAARGGQAAAQKELNNFRARVEQSASDGNSEAQQLSLLWQ